MNKIKKIFISLGAFIVATFTKMGGLISRAAMLNPVQILYGPPPGSEPKQLTTGEKISRIAKPVSLVAVFIIGLFVLFVILSKKITNRVKKIVISVLIILAIFGYVLTNYIATNL